jgi:hypothetical protein
MPLTSRLATLDDLPALKSLMRAAIDKLQVGFTRLELMATLSGEALYRAEGFEAIEHVTESSGGVPIPLIRMGKAIAAQILE